MHVLECPTATVRHPVPGTGLLTTVPHFYGLFMAFTWTEYPDSTVRGTGVVPHVQRPHPAAFNVSLKNLTTGHGPRHKGAQSEQCK